MNREQLRQEYTNPEKAKTERIKWEKINNYHLNKMTYQARPLRYKLLPPLSTRMRSRQRIRHTWPSRNKRRNDDPQLAC